VCVCVCIYIYIYIYIYTHTHISECVGIAYELTLLPNNTASETFLQKPGEMGSASWKFIIGLQMWNSTSQAPLNFSRDTSVQQLIPAGLQGRFLDILHSLTPLITAMIYSKSRFRSLSCGGMSSNGSIVHPPDCRSVDRNHE